LINIHLNGDIVRCPDIRAAQLRAIERRDTHNICKYNIHEDSCQAWQNSLMNWQSVKRNNCAGRCKLSGSTLCPQHIKRVETGRKQKEFRIDNTTYRKIASSAHYLVKESDTKTLFLTLTFPAFKRTTKLTKSIRNNEIANYYFSKFVENLRKTYQCRGYIAVREFGENTNRVHFHLLCSIPFVPFPILNAAWCNSIKNICHSSKNAITSDKKTRFVTNPTRAMRYVCKYFAKAKNTSSTARLVFISNNIIQRPRYMRQSSEYGFLDSFKFDYMRQTSDYTTIFRITDTKEFNRFCKEFLYPFFELSDKKNNSLYSFPNNYS